MMYHITRLLWSLFVAPFLSIKVTGRHHVPERGAFILASQHISILDPWIVTHALGLGWRPVRWVAGINLYTVSAAAKKFAAGKNCVVAWCVGFAVSTVVRYSLTVPVEREEDGGRRFSTVNKQAFVTIKHILGSPDGIVGIFPEGGINRNGMVHASFVSLAQRFGVPIIPVRLTARNVVFGEPIIPLKGLSVTGRVEEARKIMMSIYALGAVTA